MTAAMSCRRTAASGFARVQAFQLDEFFLMLFEKRCRPLQDAAALGRPHSAPNLERARAAATARSTSALFALGHLGDGLFGGGIEVDGYSPLPGATCLPSMNNSLVIKITLCDP